MRSISSFVGGSLVLILWLACAAAGAKDEGYKHPGTGIVFSDTIGELRRGGVTNYEADHPGLGISVKYRGDGIIADIYIYDMGLKKIPSDPTSPILKTHFQAVLKDIYIMEKLGRYKSVKEIKEDVINLGEKSPVKALHSLFSLTMGGHASYSHVFLWEYENKFFKIRYSYVVPAKADAEKNLKKLLEYMAKACGKKPGE